MPRSLYGRLTRRFRVQPDLITRREMLGKMLAAGAGLLLSQSLRGGEIAPRSQRVCVVGAGFAGLSCAYQLKSAGYQVTLIEARKRISGRVLSLGDLIPRKNVEGGGEFIGSNHPTWLAYAREFGLKFLDVTDDAGLNQPLVLQGKRIDDKQAAELHEAMEALLNKMNDDARGVIEDQPWLTPGAAALDKLNTADWIARQDAPPLAKLAAIAELTGNNGVAIERQSYLGNLAQIKGGGVERYWTDSEVYRCDGGNQTLAVKLAEKIGGDSILLGLPVTRIAVKENGVSLTCADNRRIAADDVILTVPPSTWHLIGFEPALPETLNAQMGVGVKYLAVTKGRFWKETKLAADSASDGDIAMTWEGTDGQPAEGEAELTAFSSGPQADRCRSIPPDQRDKKYARMLSLLYPDFAKSFVRSRFMDWASDRWTQASYSFPAPGQVTSVGPMLHKGLGRLHFAGEATCYKFVGYMEGALNSGAAMARRLAARDGITLPHPPPSSAPTSAPHAAQSPQPVEPDGGKGA